MVLSGQTTRDGQSSWRLRHCPKAHVTLAPVHATVGDGHMAGDATQSCRTGAAGKTGGESGGSMSTPNGREMAGVQCSGDEAVTEESVYSIREQWLLWLLTLFS